MNKTLDLGKTLLVDGPASVTIISGKAEVFGFQATNPYNVIIREGKRLPFTAKETTKLWISLGPKSCIKEIDGSTIPASWENSFDKVKKIQKRPATIMVIGGIDSGKTSFCTYLTNRLVSNEFRVAVLDEDLGQSDIGPPCTVAYAYVKSPVTDMFNLQEQNAVFIGTTSPSEALTQTLEAAVTLKSEILSKNTVDFVVVNTDGWVADEEAAKFKMHLAQVLQTDIVFCLHNKEDPNSLCDKIFEALPNCSQERTESSIATDQRDREKRRSLRELGYTKYLKNAKTRIFLAHHITIKGNLMALDKQCAENLLIGMYGSGDKFLGIGIIEKVDYARTALRIFTTVLEKPRVIVIGKVMLAKNLNENSEQTAFY